ncbi:hypothetical protein TESG_03659 [Trichophyton tonsurans CBS 112818]|uniref:F-box domain-containing protein n=1 Tax=Trichophyton tonsurans (strain CBS 112818) TaxID=647933 RepID=F2RY07_TRIT1|nr:hypothetical protein TESG_03659 [Trichophyton tonsurans CBS 112818]
MDRISPLPLEVRCMIADACDPRTLPSLSLVAKAFVCPAQRAIFHSVHKTVEGQADVRVLGRPGAINQYRPSWIQLLLRALFECPRLAEYVKHVHILVHDNWRPIPFYDKKKGAPIQSHKRVVPRKFIELGLKLKDEKPFLRRNKTWKKTWKAALFQGNDEAMLALALSLFDSLTVIDISPELLYYSQFISPIFNHFSGLQHVSFCIKGTCHYAGELGLAFTKFKIMKHHDIKTLELSAHDSHMDIMRKDLLHTHPSLTTLRLKFCDLTISTVGDILDHTPALKVFECRLLREYFSSSGQAHNHQSLMLSHLDFGQLAIDLEKVASTLEELTIGVVWSGMGFYAVEEDPSWFRGIPVYSLKHLELLSHLEIPVEILIGLRPWTGPLLSCVLPPKLKSLVLVDTLPYPCRDRLEDYSAMPVMNQLAAYLADSPSKLRKVTVNFYVKLECHYFYNCEHEVRRYIDLDEVRLLAVSLTNRGITLEIGFHWTEYDEASTLWRGTYSPEMSTEVSNLGLRYTPVITAGDAEDEDSDDSGDSDDSDDSEDSEDEDDKKEKE